MFKNTAIKITTNKLASTSASLLPGTLVIISGIVVWRLWYKQAQLQTKTSEMSDELKYIKKQIAKTKATHKADKESEDSLSSSLKKIANFNLWPTRK